MIAQVREEVFTSPEYPFAPIAATVKLDQNEAPEDFPDHLKSLVLQRLASQEWNRYPDLNSENLCRAIGLHDQWNPAGIVAATGSNVLIALLIQLSALQSRVVTVKPNFALYGLDAKLLGAALTEVPLNSDFTLDIQAVIDELGDGPENGVMPSGVIYIPRPHAPSGSLSSIEELKRLADAAEKWLVVIDEAYYHFAKDHALDVASRHSNVVLLRTFSKAWGLAGIRLGYALTSPDLAKQLRKLVPPFAISVMQSVCAEIALENPSYMQERVSRIKMERDRIANALSAHASWRVIPSEGNFLLIRTPNALNAFNALLREGIVVRRQDAYFGLEGCIRVSVGTREENDTFLRAAASIQ